MRKSKNLKLNLFGWLSLLVFVIICALMLVMLFNEWRSLELYMFSDLSECSAIEQMESETVKITVYDSPKKDKYLKDLKYSDFYACKYSSLKMSFTLYAYEFPDQKTAQAYFANVRTETDETTTFCSSSGITTYRTTVIHENRAYSFRTHPWCSAELRELLSQIFSQKVINIKNGMNSTFEG